MATKVIILALIFSLFFISQVSSESKKIKETSHLSQALHVFSRVERKLMNNMVLDISKYFKERLVSGGLALAPAPSLSPSPSPSPNPSQVECSGLCKNRCRLHSRPKVCLRACGSCCARCKCVPPGTFGNREMCGTCYTGMTTHGNKPKCP